MAHPGRRSPSSPVIAGMEVPMVLGDLSWVGLLFLTPLATAQSVQFSSISPDEAPDVGGTQVTLVGSGLDQVYSITIGGAPLMNMQVRDSSTVIGNVPPGPVGPVDIKLTYSQGRLILLGAFQYLPSRPDAGFALEFDGVNDLAQVGTVAPLNEHSIEAWYEAPEGSLSGMLAGHVSGPAEWCGFGFGLSGGASDTCYVLGPGGCGNTVFVCQSGDYAGTWTHLAGTWRNGLARFYVNGTLVQEANNLWFQSSTWMLIGAVQFANGTQGHVSGRIDELRIWDRELTIQEIRDHMQRRLTGGEPGLVGYWRFDEGSGQTAFDSSPSGTHATLGTSSSADSQDPTWVVSDAPIYRALHPPVISFCSGDVGNPPCPCGNPGSTDHGCGNAAFASGASLRPRGAPSVAGGSFALEVHRSVPALWGVFLQGVDGHEGNPFGNGRLCILPSQRLEVSTADASGHALSTVDLAAQGGVSAGEIRHYQWWYRDPNHGACTSGFNLSNALQVVWGP